MMEELAKVNSNERVDDLQIQGLKVIQNPEFFCFGIDAVLLANFAQFRKGAHIAEFCAGNAVISILLTAKQHPAHILAVEMQPELADLARRSVVLNALEGVIKVVCSDVKDLVRHPMRDPARESMRNPMGDQVPHGTISKKLGSLTFDEDKSFEIGQNEGRCIGENEEFYIEEESLNAIVINPPYVRKGSGLTCSNQQKHIARQETTCGIEDFLSISAQCLKKGGDLFMVHRPDRLVDIFWAARRNGLEPKELTLVHPQVGKPANIALIRFRRGAGAELKMGAPIYVYDEAGNLQYAGGALYGREGKGEQAEDQKLCSANGSTGGSVSGIAAVTAPNDAGADVTASDDIVLDDTNVPTTPTTTPNVITATTTPNVNTRTTVPAAHFSARTATETTVPAARKGGDLC